MPDQQRPGTVHPGERTHAWRLLDAKFRRYWLRYVMQCLIATAVMLSALLILDEVQQTALIASLGASSFIAFAMPHIHSSQPRYLLGSYAIGTIVGCAMSLLAGLLVLNFEMQPGLLYIVCAAGAVGLAIFIMVITDTEHPPAAALALGYVLNDWNVLTMVVVFAGILLIVIVKQLSKPLLIDLL